MNPLGKNRKEPCLLLGKVKKGSDISTLRNSQFLASDSYVFVPGLENISARWKIGNTKYSTLIGYGEIGMIEDMNVCQHPRVRVAHDLQDTCLSDSRCRVYYGALVRQR